MCKPIKKPWAVTCLLFIIPTIKIMVAHSLSTYREKTIQTIKILYNIFIFWQ